MIARELAVSIALIASLPACDLVRRASGEPGSGTARSEVRDLHPFSEIEVGGAVNVELAIAETQRVEVSGDDNLVPLVTTEVKGSRLSIGTSKQVDPKLELVVRINAPALDGFAVSGAGKAALRGLRGDKLRLGVSGAAEMSASGTSRHVDIDVSGAGSVNAGDLVAETARVEVSGSGDVEVHASRSLDVDISGAGKVRYRGDPPDIQKEISGAGSLQKR